MTILGLTAFALFGTASAALVMGFTSSKLHLVAAGDVPLDLVDETATSSHARFGGASSKQATEPAVAAFPRAF